MKTSFNNVLGLIAILLTCTFGQLNSQPIIFAKSNFGGHQFHLQQNAHYLGSIHSHSVFKTHFIHGISSIAIPHGWVAVLYEHPNYTGRFVTLNESFHDLRFHHFAHRARSIKIFRRSHFKHFSNHLVWSHHFHGKRKRFFKRKFIHKKRLAKKRRVNKFHAKKKFKGKKVVKRKRTFNNKKKFAKKKFPTQKKKIKRFKNSNSLKRKVAIKRRLRRKK